MSFYRINSAGIAEGYSVTISSIARTGTNQATLTFATNDDAIEFLERVALGSNIDRSQTGHVALSHLFVTSTTGGNFVLNEGIGWTRSTTSIVFTYTDGTERNASVPATAAFTTGTRDFQSSIRVYGGEAALIFNASDAKITFQGVGGGTGDFDVGIRRQSGKTTNRDAVNGGSRDVSTETLLQIGARSAVILENTGDINSHWTIFSGAVTSHGTVAQFGEEIYFAPVN